MFVPSPTDEKIKGTIGGRREFWYKAKPDPIEPRLLQTTFAIPGGRPELPLKTYVWVSPQLRRDLPNTFKVIAGIRFKERWYNVP